MTDEERQILTKRLADAEEAYHSMMLGTKASVIVDSNGERIEFARSESSKLAAYINSLKTILGLNNTTGPLGVFF